MRSLKKRIERLEQVISSSVCLSINQFQENNDIEIKGVSLTVSKEKENLIIDIKIKINE